MTDTVSTRLAHRMVGMRDSGRFSAEQLQRFAQWIENAPEEELYRVNAIQFAQQQKLNERDAIDLFVHSARAGVFDFAWGVICPSCAGLIGSRGGLKGIEAGRHCRMCEVDVLGCMDDAIEVAFTVNSAVRRLRFHGDWLREGRSADQLADDVRRVYFSSLVDATGFVWGMFSRAMKDTAVASRDVPAVRKFNFEGGGSRVLVPAVHAVGGLVADPNGASEADLEIHDGYLVPGELKLRPGPVTLRVHNRTDAPEQLFGMFINRQDVPGGDEASAADEEEDDKPLPPFLSAKRLLTTQSFRELFRAESLAGQSTLELRSLSVLFTDLKASTQLYERVGDLRALELVREHFRLLGDVIDRCEGAVVKTIGDAVMATFSDPRQAAKAGVEMHRVMRQLAGPEELALKVGVHTGPVVVIDSNERLDYFGQTVNIAARVQALAEGRELVVTDALLGEPGVRDVLNAQKVQFQAEDAHLKGVSSAVKVHRAVVA
jgi:class 3 adenylate cyclase